MTICIQPFRHNNNTGSGQTDRRTDRNAVSISRLCMLSHTRRCAIKVERPRTLMAFCCSNVADILYYRSVVTNSFVVNVICAISGNEARSR